MARDWPHRRKKRITRPRRTRRTAVRSAESEGRPGSVTMLPNSGAVSNDWVACNERADDRKQVKDRTVPEQHCLIANSKQNGAALNLYNICTS